MTMLKNTFKCTKTSTAIEQFLNSSGTKLSSFAPMKAEEYTDGGSMGGGSNHNLSGLGSSFNIGSMNPSLFNQLGPKFANVINNTGSPVLQTRNTAKKGQSLQTTLNITFKESVYGCNKTIEFSRGMTCSHCQGHGIKFMSSNAASVNGSPTSSSCRDCNGRGVLYAKMAQASVATTCTSCSGSSSPADGVYHNSGTDSGHSHRYV